MRSERALVIGVGGIGAPLLWALAASGRPMRLLLCDDDVVERTNLHRQILFDEADVGRDKLAVTAERLRGSALEIELFRGRFEPAVAAGLVAEVDAVVDCSDNFATRFLAADAAFLGRKPLVSAAAVRLAATIVSAGPEGAPCYRCLFEDLPEGDAPDCATAGVVPMVCGVAGGVAADHLLSIFAGDTSRLGVVTSFDALRDRLRTVRVPARQDCALCGERRIVALEEERYLAAEGCSA